MFNNVGNAVIAVIFIRRACFNPNTEGRASQIWQYFRDYGNFVG
jgi:hypothetical protein